KGGRCAGSLFPPVQTADAARVLYVGTRRNPGPALCADTRTVRWGLSIQERGQSLGHLTIIQTGAGIRKDPAPDRFRTVTRHSIFVVCRCVFGSICLNLFS